jgi:hypothetical protein
MRAGRRDFSSGSISAIPATRWQASRLPGKGRVLQEPSSAFLGMLRR